MAEGVMKYLLLIYVDETKLKGTPAAESAALWREARAFLAQLESEANYREGALLEPTVEALTLRRRGADLLTAEGPFAQVREQLGGFILIDAGHLDAAIALAAKVPLARYGSVEVRPVRELVP
jgi:hypothetical protein